MDYSSAGILFEDSGGDEPLYLSGWNPKLSAWSGLGGKRRENETAWQTALREVIEELFGFRIRKQVLDMLSEDFTPIDFYQNGTYVFFVCPIDFVFKICKRLEDFGYKSPFYIKYPITVYELLESRNYEHGKNPEITDLRLISFSFSEPTDPYFKADLDMIQKQFH